MPNIAYMSLFNSKQPYLRKSRVVGITGQRFYRKTAVIKSYLALFQRQN